MIISGLLLSQNYKENFFYGPTATYKKKERKQEAVGYTILISLWNTFIGAHFYFLFYGGHWTIIKKYIPISTSTNLGSHKNIRNKIPRFAGTPINPWPHRNKRKR